MSIVTDLKALIDETNKKNAALDDQAEFLSSLSSNTQLMSSLQLTTAFISKLAELHTTTRERSESYLHSLKDYFLFYFQVGIR